MMQDYSFWEYEAYHRTWDICIIGSGITGLSTGISLLEKNPKASVLIIDRWFIPLGASTRNAGFSCFGSPSEVLEDIDRMGEEATMSLVKKRWLGLQLLQRRLKGSKAQYENEGGYELYDEHEYEVVHGKLDYLNSLMAEATGHHSVFRRANVPEGIRNFSKAVFNPYDGQLHPGFMMEHLKEKYVALGGKLWTGLHIDAIKEENDVVYLRSKFAFPVETKQVVVTTNAFAASLLSQLDVHGARNHVLVTDPVPGLKWKGCFHYDRGYYYFRNIGNRILLGGARNLDIQHENTEAFGENPLIVEALEAFLYRHLADPDITKISYRWSGIIAVGPSKTPIIEAVSPRIFAGVRCSGMGIALASMIGEELSDMVLQHRTPSNR